MLDWKISDKPFALVTDNASVMSDAAKKLQLINLGCAAHTVMAYLSTELQNLTQLKQTCRKNGSFFLSITLASLKLTEC